VLCVLNCLLCENLEKLENDDASFLETKCNRLFGLQNWNEKYRTLISSARYVGLAGSRLGGVEADPPPNKKFQSPVWGSSSTSGG